MPDHFISRLISKMSTTTSTTGEGLSISIRPAITPDILPETFYLPDQRLVSSILPAYRKSPFSGSTDAANVATEAPTKVRSLSRWRDLIDIMNAKDTEIGKSEANNFKVVAPDTADSKTVRDFAVGCRVSSEEMDVIENAELEKSAKHVKEPGLNGSRKDIDISGFKLQENSVESSGTGELRSPTSGTVVVTPRRESAQLRHEEGLFAAALKAQQSLQTGKKIEALHSEPEIIIKIGRIDVRAVMPEKPTSKTQRQLPPPPLSLKEYLKQRSEGRL